MDRKFLMTAFGYGIIGLALGIYMGISENHGQLVTHAHIMLLGFLVSFVYAVCYKLWLIEQPGAMRTAQYWTHQVGTLGLTIGLFLLYGAHVGPQQIGPVLGIFSITAFIGLLLMQVMLAKAGKA